MNVLIIGSGGREHALAWKISKSLHIGKIFCAPGNAGTAGIGTNLNIGGNEFEKIREAVLEHHIDLVVVGPEDPLVNGIVDYFNAEKLLNGKMILGPDKFSAQLEGSKDFAKNFMIKYNIPTAKYKSFDSNHINQAFQFLDEMKPPYVLKADGLAAGKGVVILNSKEEAKEELLQMLKGKFGDAGKKVVIEEFLKGIELSVFVITDGLDYKILPEAKDYKRIGEGDNGLNTGGMGAVSPVSFAGKNFMLKVENDIIKPTIKGIQQEKMNYKGFIFFGLINVGGNPFVIEYNARLGDPETEVVLPRIKSDFLEILIKACKQELSSLHIDIENKFATTVMLVSSGYPGDYEKGKKIEIGNTGPGTTVFHAGTKLSDENIVTSGGRVIAVTGYGNTMHEALAESYRGIENINFEGKTYRKDIGFDL
ncbi:MAG: phosphoribosylamine--glycine ligase [Bacteroidales bacterium]